MKTPRMPQDGAVGSFTPPGETNGNAIGFRRFAMGPNIIMKANNLSTDTNDIHGQLITLRNGLAGIRMPITGEVTADKSDPVITFTASDGTLDRYNEIIAPEGWQFKNYLRNPIFQADHTYSIQSTIGRCVRVWVEGGKLKQTIAFATGINPMADMVLALYRGGFLNAVSVGFIPKRWENGSESTGFRRRYIETELVELSAVAVPTNPNALQDAIMAGVVTSGHINEAEDSQDFQQTVSSANGPASGERDTPAGLLAALQTAIATMRGK